MHRVWEENSWFDISYCKVRKETRLITVIINQLLKKSALIINESLGEDCGAQWFEIYWLYCVCQGQESTAPLEMSKEQRNTDICVHSWQTELISDVFWPCTWAAGKKAETVSFLFFFLSGVGLRRRGENGKQLKAGCPHFWSDGCAWGLVIFQIWSRARELGFAPKQPFNRHNHI